MSDETSRKQPQQVDDTVADDKALGGSSVAFGNRDAQFGTSYQAGNNITNIYNYDHAPNIIDPQERRHRARLMGQVRDFWIKGVLDKSLHGAVLIALGLESRPDALLFPWEMVSVQPGRERQRLAPGKTILDCFIETDGDLLILGAPGSGKTTMLLDLARVLLDRAEVNEVLQVPAVFNLSLWAESRLPLAEWLESELSQRYGIPPEVGRGWITRGQLIALLDGLDEVKIEHRNDCVAAINTFRKEEGLSLVVCSRIIDYEALTTKLQLRDAVLIQPLTQAQIEYYLDQAGDQLRLLREAVTSNTALRELAETPLMLSVMALTYHGRTTNFITMSSSIEELQQQIFAAYVQRMLARPRLDAKVEPEAAVKQLKWLAHGMMEHNLSVFYIESLQPTWLGSQRERYAYIFAVVSIIVLLGTVVGTLVGFVVGLLSNLLLYRIIVSEVQKIDLRTLISVAGAIIGGVLSAWSVSPIIGRHGAQEKILMTERLHWSWSNARRLLSPSKSLWESLVIGLISGILFGVGFNFLSEKQLIGFLDHISWLFFVFGSEEAILQIVLRGLCFGVALGLFVWFLLSLVAYLVRVDEKITGVFSWFNRRFVAQDRPKFYAFFCSGFISGLCIGVGSKSVDFGVY